MLVFFKLFFRIHLLLLLLFNLNFLLFFFWLKFIYIFILFLYFLNSNLIFNFHLSIFILINFFLYFYIYVYLFIYFGLFQNMFSIFLNKTGISSQFFYDNNGPPYCGPCEGGGKGRMTFQTTNQRFFPPQCHFSRDTSKEFIVVFQNV